MLKRTTSISRRSLAAGLALAMLLVGAMTTAAVAHPDPTDRHHGQEEDEGVGVRVNSPPELAGFHPGVQWADAGEIANQTANLVYAGTGCTPASYLPVADEIQGNIALVDERVSQTNPADQCPQYTFFQKVQSAQQAGAIGFVQIPGEAEGDDEPRTNATAVTADIPAIEVFRTAAILAVRDAVIADTEVNATLTPPPPPPVLEPIYDAPCVDGMAGPFPCEGVDLLAFVPREEFNASSASVSDIWGWTDPETNDEYVFFGKTDGTAFFRVTDPTNPVYLGELPNPALLHARWHDMKVYENHAFIVSESEPHGMSVFDLTRLRGVTEPEEWDRDAWYPLNDAAHNVAINEETGFAYIVGGNFAGAPDQCLSGLHMVDIREPKSPAFAGCYLMDGGPGLLGRTAGGPVEENSPAAYVHDTQCVIYRGPDEDHTGREICFNASEDQITIADVTNKLLPTTVSEFVYPDVAYAHQGWLSEDHRFLFVNDELDEVGAMEDTDGDGQPEPGMNTRTIVLDVADLDEPKLHFEHFHDVPAIDHNNYVHEGLLYQSNYTSGLRVLDTSSVEEKQLEQVAFFDIHPATDDPIFAGTWSNYPFFESGTIAVSGIDEGLFLLRLQDGVVAEPGVDISCADCPIEVRPGESGTAELVVRNTGNVDDVYELTVPNRARRRGVTIEPSRIAVPAGEQRRATLTVPVPPRGRPGTYTLVVTATSTVDPSVSDAETVEIVVRQRRP